MSKDSNYQGPVQPQDSFRSQLKESTASSTMFNLPLPTENIRSLILEKEKELHDINEYRLRSLEGLLHEKEAQVTDWKQKFDKLRDDFQYNLKLIEERDKELSSYDVTFVELKDKLKEREEIVNELQIKVSDLECCVSQERTKSAEQENFYQRKLKDVREELETSKWAYDDEQRQQREEFELFKQQITRQVQEKEEDLDNQRRDITTTFEEVLRQREQRFKSQFDEVRDQARGLDTQCKSQKREIEQQKQRNEQLKSEVEELQKNISEREKELKDRKWEFEDLRNEKDTKIAALVEEKTNLQSVKSSLLHEYETKMSELLQSLHSVERAFMQQKEQYENEMTKVIQMKDDEVKNITSRLQARVETLSTKVKSAEDALERANAESKNAKYEYEEQLQKRYHEIEVMKGEIQDLKDENEKKQNEMKNELWGRDLEIKASSEKIERLRQVHEELNEQLQGRKEEIQALRDKQDELRKEMMEENSKAEDKLKYQEQELSTKHHESYEALEEQHEKLRLEKRASEELLSHLQNELQKTKSDLYALQAETRVSETYGTSTVTSHPTSTSRATSGTRRRSATASVPSDNNRVSCTSSSSSSQQFSPAFSEDMGLASSINGMGSFGFSDTELSPPGSMSVSTPHSNANDVRQLEKKNTELRSIISQMRKEMEELTAMRSSSSSSLHGELCSPTHNVVVQQLHQQKEYTNFLQKRVEELESSHGKALSSTQSAEISILRKQNRDMHTAIETYEQQLQRKTQETLKLNELIAKKDAEIGALKKRIVQFQSNPDTSNSSQSSEVLELRKKVIHAQEDIKRLTRERNQLMEASNQLRSELKRQTSDRSYKDTKNPTEHEITLKYEKKMREIELHMQEFQAQNENLRNELKRVKVQGLNINDNSYNHSDDHSDSQTKYASSRNPTVMPVKGYPSVHPPSILEQLELDKVDEESLQGSPSPSSRSRITNQGPAMIPSSLFRQFENVHETQQQQHDNDEEDDDVEEDVVVRDVEEEDGEEQEEERFLMQIPQIRRTSNIAPPRSEFDDGASCNWDDNYSALGDSVSMVGGGEEYDEEEDDDESEEVEYDGDDGILEDIEQLFAKKAKPAAVSSKTTKKVKSSKPAKSEVSGGSAVKRGSVVKKKVKKATFDGASSDVATRPAKATTRSVSGSTVSSGTIKKKKVPSSASSVVSSMSASSKLRKKISLMELTGKKISSTRISSASSTVSTGSTKKDSTLKKKVADKPKTSTQLKKKEG